MAKAFWAVVLAADRRGEQNEVARASGVPAKALAPVGGVPMLFRVLGALEACVRVEKTLLLAPEVVFEAARDRFAVEWLVPESSITESVQKAFARIPSHTPVLVTTGDNALLKAEAVEAFLEAIPHAADLAIGLVRYQAVKARFPSTRRTTLSFSDGPFCGCNLYAFLTPKGRETVRLWRAVEKDRKRPWKYVGHFDVKGLALYLLGRLSSEKARERIKNKFGVDVAFTVLPYPEVAIDVDTLEDLRLADRLARSLS